MDKPKHPYRKPSGRPLSLPQARRHVERQPGNAKAWLHMAQLLAAQQGEQDEACQAFERVLELEPQHHAALEGLAQLALKQHQPMQALKYLEQALALAPESVPGLNQLARIYLELATSAKAVDAAEKAANLAPDNQVVLDTYGSALASAFRFEEAMAVFDRLTQIAPGNFVHWNNAGNMRREVGLLEEAYRCYQKAAGLAPKNPIAYSNHLTALHYDPTASRAQISEFARSWEKRFAPTDVRARPLPKSITLNKRLRIGMLSDGFRNHPVGKMIVGCLEHLEASQVEIYAYSSSEVSDELTRRIKKVTGEWRSIRYLSDEELDRLLRDDELDILVDLSGHNTGSRMRVMAMQSAPLLVKWVGGLINTTGVQAIDYLISDHIETPEGEDEFYTEQLIRMPNDYIVFQPPARLPVISELPAKRNGYITLACFNNPTKLNHITLQQWALLMHQLPGSRLLLKGRPYTSDAFCERLYNAMESEGITRERLIIEGPGTNYEMLEAYSRADIALDPWPYSGGLTTCEAFIMGLPVVTMTGPTFAGRHSATHLVHVGMPELVTHSWEEYHARVLELASDINSLSTIRQHLRDVLLQSPVCDGPRFAKHFTIAMRAVWQRYCEGKPPAALSFDEENRVWFEGESTPVEVQYAETLDIAASGFNWELPSKIITIDNSAKLFMQGGLAKLRGLKAFGIVAFDPASRIQNPGQYQDSDDIQIFPHAVLGDGKPATLYACLNPALSSTLEPFSPEQQVADNAQDIKVLAKLPINSIALDSIEGLGSLDWLILDDLSDAMAILENGEKALKETLIIQVRIAFQPTHQRQPNLAEVQHWMSRHGFRFYRFNNEQHRSHLPESVPEEQRQATELTSADALFMPSYVRMAILSKAQRIKLAFLLHTIFGIKDMAYEVLAGVDEEKAEGYLEEETLLASPYIPKKHPKSSKNVRDIMNCLEQAVLTPIAANHTLPGQLIISLTSYKARFDNLHFTLRSLLLQKASPDHLILWIAEDEKDDLPQSVWKLEKSGLSIRFCEDIRSYKKIIPSLREFSDSFIVTADDDIYYESNWLKGLIDDWDGNKKTVVSHRAHKIKLDDEKQPVTYLNWKWQVGASEQMDGLIFPTSGAGALYPPHVFHKDVTDEKRFMELCPDADDIWLYWMASLNGAKAKRSNYDFQLIEWPSQDASPLWKENVQSGGNDKQIKRMLTFYGKPWESITDWKNDIFSFSYLDERIYFSLPNANDHIQKIIKSTRSFYELEMLEDIKKRLPPSSVIFDIGSNIGNHSIFFGKFCQAKKVVAFEPHPKTFSILEKNIRANSLEDTVSCYNVGMAESLGYSKVSFYNSQNIGMTKLERTSAGSIELETVDSVARREGLTVGAMKIDVEGMELDVLKGAEETLKYSDPLLYVEAGDDPSFRKIKNHLSELGYEAKAKFNATATYLFIKNQRTTRVDKKTRWHGNPPEK